MTLQETAKVMDIIKGAYPSWQATKQTALVWAQMFVDDPLELVLAAVKSYIASDSKGFAPVVGQIKKIMTDLLVDDMNENEAWSLVRKAISNGIYGSVEEYEALPPILKKVVGSPDQLSEWAMLTDGLDTVVASNVMRSYRKEVERQKFERALPNDVKLALGGAVKLIGGTK